jgi:uncharacterized protein (DUF1810 family)
MTKPRTMVTPLPRYPGIPRPYAPTVETLARTVNSPDDPADDAAVLARIREAQDSPTWGSGPAAHVRALDEIKAGEKLSHWCWFVLPMLGGLRGSSTAQKYALPRVSTAHAYVKDATLRARLLEMMRAIDAHLSADPPADVVHLMGIEVDVQKLISCACLFAHVAHAEKDRELADVCARVRDAACAQGWPDCPHTRHSLGLPVDTSVIALTERDEEWPDGDEG